MTIRILVAEDSSTARALLVAIFRADPELEVVGEAADGLQAVELVRALHPDVVTMDLQMPGMDGFEAIQRIMSDVPVPIVVVSDSIDPRDVEVSLRALGAGALTLLRKPRGPSSAQFEEESRHLRSTVKSMAEVKVVRRWRSRPEGLSYTKRLTTITPAVIVIGASTGGPAALHRILTQLRGEVRVPMLVVQHIALGFTAGLVDWLNGASSARVVVAREGECVQNGVVYVAPDEHHLGVTIEGRLLLSKGAALEGHRPSASFLFASVARAYGSRVLAVILTGMGRDGVEGLRAVRQAGGRVLAQDEETSVVFGMPGAAVKAGLVDLVMPLDAIGPHLLLNLEPQLIGSAP